MVMSTNDKDTLFARQQNTVDDAGGRYSKLNPAKIVGSTPAPYPQLPGNSPFAKGIDEIVGVGLSLSADDLGGSMAPTDASLSDVETDPPKTERSSDDP